MLGNNQCQLTNKKKQTMNNIKEKTHQLMLLFLLWTISSVTSLVHVQTYIQQHTYARTHTHTQTQIHLIVREVII